MRTIHKREEEKKLVSVFSRTNSLMQKFSASKKEISLTQVVQLLNEMRKDNRRMERELENLSNSGIQVLKMSLRKLTLNLSWDDRNRNPINYDLKNENEDLTSCCFQITVIFQSYCLELHNCLVYINEDLMPVVVWNSLGCTDQQIDNCYGLRSNQADIPLVILLKFTRGIDKEELVRRRRKRSTARLSMRHLTFLDDTPLYLNALFLLEISKFEDKPIVLR